MLVVLGQQIMAVDLSRRRSGFRLSPLDFFFSSLFLVLFVFFSRRKPYFYFLTDSKCIGGLIAGSLYQLSFLKYSNL